MANVLKQVPDGPAAVAAIGVTNQRETVVVWNRRTGEPIYPAIVWQCRRTADFCSELKRRDYGPRIRDKTGLVIDAYFSASKLRWILDHVDGAREAAQRGELLCGTIDSWLLWKLSNGTAHVTDYTNASRTMLFNIRTLQWDAELLDLFGIPSSMLPTPVPSSGEAARCALPEFEGREVPVLGVSGDQQAALFGQGCFAPGQIKNTYGTGCFLLMHTGGEAVSSANGLVTTLTAQTLAGAPSYALEGSVFVGGAVVQWLRDELRIVTRSSDVGPIAASIPDTGGVFLVPALAGLGAPHWDMYARGTLVGMTRGTGRAQIIRAAVESTAYQCGMWSMRCVRTQDNRSPPCARTVAPGDDFLMQFQADLLECRVERPTCIETTALGAASLAALRSAGKRPRRLPADRPPACSRQTCQDATQCFARRMAQSRFACSTLGNRELRRPTPASKTA